MNNLPISFFVYAVGVLLVLVASGVYFGYRKERYGDDIKQNFMNAEVEWAFYALAWPFILFAAAIAIAIVVPYWLLSSTTKRLGKQIARSTKG